jgi:hypothetical protein
MQPLHISHPSTNAVTQNVREYPRCHNHTFIYKPKSRSSSPAAVCSSTFLIQPFSEGILAAEPKEEQLLIYIDLKKAMDAGIKFYASSAGLVTPGDEAGFLRPRFFQYVYVRVIQRKTLLGKPSQPWLVTPKRPLSTTRLRLGLNPRRR